MEWITLNQTRGDALAMRVVLSDATKWLKSLDANSVDLVATDPPYMTGRDWVQYDDRWTSRDAYVDAIRQVALEAHRVLKPTGNLYLQCDWRADAYLRVMLDEVFGAECFRNSIAWCYPPGGRGPNLAFHRKHDTIFHYGMSDAGTFNRPYHRFTARQMSKFTKIDDDGRRYQSYPNGRAYLDELDGSPVPDWWVDIPSLGQNVNAEECTGYPTQKPIALYERIIMAGSNEGDLVVDPFAGSGTTMIASKRLNRRFAGCDINAAAVELANRRIGQILL